MDISGMFNEASPNSDGSETANVDASASSSPVVDVNSLLGDDASGTASASTDDSAATPSDDQSTVSLDPLDVIVPNETITTNDSTVVGEAKEAGQPEDSSEPTVEPFIPEPAVQPEITSVPEAVVAPGPAPAPVEDVEKTDFIKTYTAEYDEALSRATDSIEKMLDSVDKSIHEKLPDITIPEEASEFLKKPPTDNKVEKFEDVRELVREVMERANEAKQQSEAAAAEASQIYDEVQAFKRDTKQQIATLTGDDAAQAASL
ncbi:MAG TPA: hypothetical protein PKC31_00400 [Candidatus Nanoperiomorbaceae bacterium]|nr:hypothetical protein [Candidatus Nanoperiomorbaceae bacterium]HMQ96489.1 hypothetical protein [Candidatus Nanoperiomorbaceae bacterium]HMR85906.1 hypothetical protein [Candidatus Nanoperiomorbaceae bacterium]HMU11755.1 hypothetical protein [Candidatus Nanoperiomorbaceae bacterium]